MPFQFPDCCSLFYETDSPLWIHQTSCAASTYKWRETWRETQATLWLLIEHMILLTCQKISFAIQIDLIHGCLSSSLVGCILYGIGQGIQWTRINHERWARCKSLSYSGVTIVTTWSSINSLRRYSLRRVKKSFRQGICYQQEEMNNDWHYKNVITNEYRDHKWIDQGRNDERI